MQSTLTSTNSLIKASDLIGLDIIAQNVGRKINDVKDIIYDPIANRVVAVVVHSSGLFSEAKLLLFEHIKSIGKDAIIVDSPDVIQSSSAVPQTVARIATDNTYLDRTEVITEDGNKLGSVTDLLFDKQTGSVKELEVSGSVIDRVSTGKKAIPIEQVITIGHDATIVSTTSESTVTHQAQTRGLAGSINSAKNTAGQQAQTVREQVPTFFQKARYRLQEAGQAFREKALAAKESPRTQYAYAHAKGGLQRAKENIAVAVDTGKEKIEQQQKNDALGQYLTVNVLDANDQLIAQRGDVITHEMLAKAESHGLLQKVVNNVSQEPGTAEPLTDEEKVPVPIHQAETQVL